LFSAGEKLKNLDNEVKDILAVPFRTCVTVALLERKNRREPSPNYLSGREDETQTDSQRKKKTGKPL